MSGLIDGAGEGGGRFANNILHFARALRAAGLPVGTGRVLEALRALEVTGVASRSDLYWTLHAVFVSRRDQRHIFDQCFHVFWRDPKLLERMMQMLMPTLESNAPQEPQATMSRRAAEAFATPGDGAEGEAAAGSPSGEEADEDGVDVTLDAVMTFSNRESLQTRDFEEMSADELALARREIGRLTLPLEEIPTRRFLQHPHGRRIDMRTTLRRSLRGGGAAIDLARRKRRHRRPPLVILCDVSGSMSRYSRMLLLFMHALTNDRDRVHSFLFGTRLTSITRYLRHRDVDLALAEIGAACLDWAGGTRIGTSLAAFNRDWSRRVLAQGAVVLLISDGLDRDAGHGLEREIERLHKSCRRLIWLNPLLRYDRYEPISTGASVLIRHTDDVRSIHNLESLAQLTEVLSHSPRRRQEGVSAWLRDRRTMAEAQPT